MNNSRHLEMKAKTNHRKEDYRYFVGTTLKNPLEYQIGEKMVFKIRVKYMDGYLDIPYISYTLVSDDGQKGEGYIAKSEDGWFYIEASISKSGFVYIQAKACDENKRLIEGISVFNGSAGANVGEVLRATKMPDDYMEFWDKLKAEVEATDPEVIFCRKIEDEAHPDFELFDMRIKAPRNEYASVAVAYPKGAQKHSLKVKMGFQGYGIRPVTPRPMDGYLSVMVGAHAMPNYEGEEFYEDLRNNALKGYGYDEVENENPDTTYWVKMMLRDLQAVRFFKSHELAKEGEFYFVGSSQGGMQACNMAAHSGVASAVILNVPWLSDIYGHELLGRRENKMPKGFGVTYFDTAVAGQHLKCPVYIIAGLGDVTCNASTEMALFNSITSQKYIEFYQNKVHSFTIPWDRNVYTLGEGEMAGKYPELLEEYYEFD